MEVTKILWGKGVENREEIPRIIWMYWEGKKSILVELCIQKIKKILPEYEINILNSKTLRDFLPNIIEKNETATGDSLLIMSAAPLHITLCLCTPP